MPPKKGIQINSPAFLAQLTYGIPLLLKVGLPAIHGGSAQGLSIYSSRFACHGHVQHAFDEPTISLYFFLIRSGHKSRIKILADSIQMALHV